MRRKPERQACLIVGLFLLFGLATPGAYADPIIVPGFTVTDLGGGTPAFSSDESGRGTLLAPTGLTFEFPQTPNTTLTIGQGIAANFPQIGSATTGSGNALGNSLHAIMNSNGLVSFSATSIIYQGTNDYGIYTVQRNPDGSWGEPTSVYGRSEQNTPFSGGGAGVTGLSKSNEVLISDYINGNPHAYLYNASSQALINLASILPASLTDVAPIAIDDVGRIVLSAIEGSPFTGYAPTNLLLTPDGVSSAPLETPVPEPGSVAVMLLAAGGFALRRVHERRRLA